MNNIGLYVHVPFCASKCPYCDFYSFRADEQTRAEYAEAVVREIKQARQKYNRTADTVYIGGGTPSVLGGKMLCEIIEAARRDFSAFDAEITVECNPHALEDGIFEKLRSVGVNRISLGLQSANDDERKKLGRRADREEIKRVIAAIRKAGIDNVSLDIMLGIPDSTRESVKSTLDFCISQDVTHISAYMLKIEENTPFFRMRDRLNLPDDDAVGDSYLMTCEYLGENGFSQYEISNFAKQGFESKHNLKYWNCDEYLGIGAAAHSFMDGRRFYYTADARAFIDSPVTVDDGEGGGFEEYAMLRLRLSDGLREDETAQRYGFPIPEKMRKSAEKFVSDGLLVSNGEGIRLTAKGFLVSNTIICELIY